MLKINGKCDDVMKLLMEELNFQVPMYDRYEVITHDTSFSETGLTFE